MTLDSLKEIYLFEVENGCGKKRRIKKEATNNKNDETGGVKCKDVCVVLEVGMV